MLSYLDWLEQGEPVDVPFSIFHRSKPLPYDLEVVTKEAVGLAMVVRDRVNHLKATKGATQIDHQPVVPSTTTIQFEGITLFTDIVRSLLDNEVLITMQAFLAVPEGEKNEN